MDGDADPLSPDEVKLKIRKALNDKMSKHTSGLNKKMEGLSREESDRYESEFIADLAENVTITFDYFKGMGEYPLDVKPSVKPGRFAAITKQSSNANDMSGIQIHEDDDNASVISGVTFNTDVETPSENRNKVMQGRELKFDLSDVDSRDHSSWCTERTEDLVDKDEISEAKKSVLPTTLKNPDNEVVGFGDSGQSFSESMDRSSTMEDAAGSVMDKRNNDVVDYDDSLEFMPETNVKVKKKKRRRINSEVQ